MGDYEYTTFHYSTSDCICKAPQPQSYQGVSAIYNRTVLCYNKVVIIVQHLVMDLEQIRIANLRVPDGEYNSTDFISQTEFNDLYSIGATSHIVDTMRALVDTNYPLKVGCIIQRLLNATQGLLLDNQCWLSNKYINATGYLQLQEGISNNKKLFGHRVSFTKYYKCSPLKGIQIRHRCDNRNCWNPLHLHLGTCKDNIRDIVYRTGNMRGINKGADLDLVVAAKRLLLAGCSIKDTSLQTGLTKKQVSDLKLHKTFTYVNVTQDKVIIT